MDHLHRDTFSPLSLSLSALVNRTYSRFVVFFCSRFVRIQLKIQKQKIHVREEVADELRACVNMENYASRINNCHFDAHTFTGESSKKKKK